MRTSGLMTDQIKRVVKAIGDKNVASMCMVGNSVFAIGPDLEILAKVLSRYGEVFQTGVDMEGPRSL
jgi:pantoate kinase